MVGSWDFPRNKLALMEGELSRLGVPGQLESAWIAKVTVVLVRLRSSSTWAISLSGSDLSESLSELSLEFVPLVGVSLKCTVLLLRYFH